MNDDHLPMMTGDEAMVDDIQVSRLNKSPDEYALGTSYIYLGISPGTPNNGTPFP